MIYSNVIVGITFSHGSFVFNQSRIKVSVSLTSVGSLAVGLYLTLRPLQRPSPTIYSPITSMQPTNLQLWYKHLLINVKDRDEPNNRQGAIYKIKCYNSIMAKLAKFHFQWTKRITLTDEHFSLDSEDDFTSPCLNISYQQQYLSEYPYLDDHTIQTTESYELYQPTPILAAFTIF